MSPDQRFDIPQELRQLAEQNVERARQLYLQFVDSLAQAVAVWSTPPSATIRPEFDRVRARSVKFAQENADAAFKLVREVANAKDLQELLSLQARYVQSQLRWYAGQTQEFGQMMGRAFGIISPQMGSPPSGSQPGKVVETDEVTDLKLLGFSIEVTTDPVILLLQTDKGSFSLEIPKEHLFNLAYALRFVLYADEPLRRKRLDKQAVTGRSYALAGKPKTKREGKSIKRSSRTNQRKVGKKQR